MNVVWLTFHDGPARGYWDQGLLELVLADCDHSEDPADITDGSVVIVPGRFNAVFCDKVRFTVEAFRCTLIISSDEESLFPWRAVDLPNVDLWVMTPRPDRHQGCNARWLGEGFAPDTPDILHGCKWESDTRPIDVVFAGQNTHARRAACVAAAEALDVETLVRPTEGFQQGMERTEYLRVLAASKIALCPSGPATPDSFRLYEALEAHCLPIVDAFTPDPSYPAGFWHMLFPGAPFEAIEDWSELPKYVDAALQGWPANANRCAAWWEWYKRDLRVALNPAQDDITVIMVTSPIPSHPSTEIITKTIESVRFHLPDAEILLMCDGVRPEQEDRRSDYDEYLRRLLWLCAHEWDNVVPFLAPEHRHQVGLTRDALEMVRTPAVLFVEHDTPLWPDPIDWNGCLQAVQSGEADLVRFHHETRVLPDHEHLMLDTEPNELHGAPMLRTIQWSQRPHLASTGFYREILAAHFSEDCRTMIEDVMHAVVQNAYNDHGLAGWQQFRLWMYAPEGSIERSYHLDGRQSDPKFDMIL